MTDRSTDNPEDQPVPVDPDETTAAEGGMAEQETMAEATPMGVGPDEDNEPSEPNELADAAEPNELTDAADAGDIEHPGEPGGEAAEDLDAEELEAAATAAEADEGADTQVVEDVEPRATPAGAAPRGTAKPPASTRAGGRTALEVDPALRIRDRASQVFVALTVIVFVAIFANAMLFGVGGALTTSAAPSPSASPASSSSPAPSGSSAPSSVPGPTFTAAPSAS